MLISLENPVAIRLIHRTEKKRGGYQGYKWIDLLLNDDREDIFVDAFLLGPEYDENRRLPIRFSGNELGNSQTSANHPEQASTSRTNPNIPRTQKFSAYSYEVFHGEFFVLPERGLTVLR